MTTTLEDVTCEVGQIPKGENFYVPNDDGKTFEGFTRVRLCDSTDNPSMPDEVFAVRSDMLVHSPVVYRFDPHEVVRKASQDFPGPMMTDEEIKEAEEREEQLHQVMDNTQERVKDYCVDPCYVHYSAFPTDPPRDNLDEFVVTGAVVLYMPGDNFFGGDKSENYFSPTLRNPTWLEVAYYANEAIKTTGDYHHAFLEGIEKKNMDMDGVPVYELVMGS